MEVLEKGQTMYVVSGMLLHSSDPVVTVQEQEIKKPIDSTRFHTYGAGVYTLGHDGFFTRAEAYDRALEVQGFRVWVMPDVRTRHLEQWEALLQQTDPVLLVGWVRENFTDSEFYCKKCKEAGQVELSGNSYMDRWFIERLQLSRKIAGIPYDINSGWRCATHNAQAGGSDTSSHLVGLAADILADTSVKRYLILGACIAAGFKRIGIGEDFIHVDDDPNKDQGVIWLYQEAA